MNRALRNSIVAGTFLLFAVIGIMVSVAAPYVQSDDELVYLTGALQAKDGNLPDAYMLQGYDYGPYLYPRIMSWWYEPLGHDVFKSVALVVLVLLTGIAAYVFFRSLELAWVPSLLLSVVALMPRFSSGQEIFGVFTWNETIGRACALPLFFLGSALLLRRSAERKSLWPVFGLFGLFLFLHPITVMLFAFISLVALFVTRLFTRTSFFIALREVIVSGVTFVLAGSYFFADVFIRLGHSAAGAGVSVGAYVQVIVFRNAWEFPGEAIRWFPHMFVVSAVFLGVIIASYAVPALRELRARHSIPYGKQIVLWGVSMAIASLVLTVLIPGVNLYLMEHAQAPYLFQQWSRISKFYYLGLFIALVPILYALWQRFVESRWRFKSFIVVLAVLIGMGSSSFGLEVTEFAVGYPDFMKAYVPQALSHIPDDTSPAQYREVCEALVRLGATSSTPVISTVFAFRYYCRANLYVTQEEGGAYQQLTRADVVSWYEALMAQRTALTNGNPQEILSFARSVGAQYVILARVSKFAAFDTSAYPSIVKTSRFLIVPVQQ